jgi:putative tricarboxylic transport membrane protein
VNQIISHSIASFLAILLAVVFYVNSLKLPPAAYQSPRLLCGIIIFLSFLMFYGAILEKRALRKEKKIAEVESKNSEEKEETSSIDYKRALIFGSLIALYIFLIKPVGYFIVTPLFILIAYQFLQSTSFTNTLLIALSFTAFVYLLFVYFLKVPIPLGPLH